MGPAEAGPATVAAAQAGYFDCAWSTAEFETYLHLEVLPDAGSAFTMEKAATIAPRNDPEFAARTVGDQAFGGCDTSEDSALSPSCRLDVLDGSTWYRVMIAGLSPDLATPARRLPDLAAVVQSTIDAVSASGYDPAPYPQPASKWASTAGCVAGTQRADDAGAFSYGFELMDNYESLLREALSIADGFVCTSPSSATRSATVIPGAAWIWPTEYRSPVSLDIPLTVPGVAEARYLCVAGLAVDVRCWAEGVIDGAFVVVDDGYGETDAGTQARDAEGLAELATANSAG